MNTDLYERLSAIQECLLVGLVEREEPVRLALLAALAGEHILLLGPPGTAKSEIARRLRHVFQDAGFFERLLTRFTVPEELFGPLSIKALEDDRYHRQTQGYLPTATVGFLDEIFKANSAILNALLTLLNEREFDNGVVREQTPIKCIIGASNELPQEEGMEALYDRFLLRCHVGSVSESGFSQLLLLKAATPEVPHEFRLTEHDLRTIRQEAPAVTLPSSVLELITALRKFLAEKSIEVSDRRWRKIIGLLKVAAYTNGRQEVASWDGWLLPHCCWSKPEQRTVIQDWCAKRMGVEPVDLHVMTSLTEMWEGKLVQEMTTRHAGYKKLRETVERVSAGGTAGVSPSDLNQWVAQTTLLGKTPGMSGVELHAEQVRQQTEALREQVKQVGDVIDRHLWISTSSDVVKNNLEDALRQHEALLARWQVIRRELS